MGKASFPYGHDEYEYVSVPSSDFHLQSVLRYNSAPSHSLAHSSAPRQR